MSNRLWLFGLILCVPLVGFCVAEGIKAHLNSELRSAIKEYNEDRLICYCYGVTMKQASTNSNIKPFVIQETKEDSCACETRNPSGRCCLKNFPKS